MSLGDALDFEGFRLKDIWKGIMKNPERLLTGAFDPWSTKIYNGITGDNLEPLGNQLGAPTKKQYQDAQAHGIDTGSARDINDAAQVIAGAVGAYAGGTALAGAGGGGGGGAAAVGGGTGTGASVGTGAGIAAADAAALDAAAVSAAAAPAAGGWAGGASAAAPAAESSWWTTIKQGLGKFGSGMQGAGGGGGGGQTQMTEDQFLTKLAMMGPPPEVGMGQQAQAGSALINSYNQTLTPPQIPQKTRLDQQMGVGQALA